MRISDWSSDVCSSDLERPGVPPIGLDLPGPRGVHRREVRVGHHDLVAQPLQTPGHPLAFRRGLEQDPGPRPRTQHFGEPLRLGADATLAQLAPLAEDARPEEHTSELQSLMRISYAVFCLKKKTKTTTLKQQPRYNNN